MMHKLKSTAVMNRRVEPPDGADDFPTPMWATRALLRHVIGVDHLKEDVREPACGRGFMSNALLEYFHGVVVSDAYEYTGLHHIEDYLTAPKKITDWVITNPPFALAEKFALKALTESRIGVALLCRGNFAESVGRYERLFEPDPPSIIAQFVERVPMVKGRCDPKATTATAYAWFVWMQWHVLSTSYVWIPPCRKDLERPGDYDL